MRFERGLLRAVLVAFATTVALTTVAACDSGAKHNAASQTTESTSQPPSSPSVSEAADTSPSSAVSSSAPASSALASSAPASATNEALRKLGVVAIPLDSTGLTIQAEGPDGTVFASTPGGTVVWTAKLGAQPTVAEHVPGGADALAADAAYLYIASGHSVYAYARSTGDVARQWALPDKGSALNLEVTGSRVWVRMGMQASDPPPDANATLVELDKSGGAPLRQVTVPWTTSLAGGPTGVYYVVSSKTLVEQSDAGTTKSAPVNDPVNLELSGAFAIQALAVDGDHVLVVHYAGQGLDAVLHTYDAGTLAGPSDKTDYTAAAALAVDNGDLVALDNEGDCGDGKACLTAVTLGKGLSPTTVAVAPGTLLGPRPAVVGATPVNGKVEVTWFGR
jgi:hypothetical protein